MRRFAIVLPLLLSLFGTLCFAAPVISVDSPVYTAEVQSGSAVSHVFTLTNAGDENLTISMVETSCGCTTATLAKMDLAPGESVGLEARVDTTGFAGKVEKTVEVQSNDPANPRLVLRLALTLLDQGPTQTPSASASSTPAPTQAPAAGASPANAVAGAPPSLGWLAIFGVALAVDVALVLLLFILVSAGT